jgi:hypothetical protein
MRLRDRRRNAKRVWKAPAGFRRFVDPKKRRNSRWRGMLRAFMSQPSEPYEMTATTYLHLSFRSVHKLGSISILPHGSILVLPR